MPQRVELTSAPSDETIQGHASSSTATTTPRRMARTAAAWSDNSEEPIAVDAATAANLLHSSDYQEEEPADERSSLLDHSSKRRRPRRSSPKPAPWYKRPSPWFIHLHLLCFALGMGMMAAPRLELFTQVICHQINEEAAASHDPAQHLPILLLTPEQCRHSIPVQRRLAELNLFLQLIMGTLCIATTPFWGSLSDRIGRKPVLILNMLSFVLGDAILVTVFSFPEKLSYFWLLLMPAFEGLFAGYGGGQAIMSAYIGDCTEAGSRAGTFSLMTGLMYGGIAAGPAISSMLIQASGKTLYAFYAVLGLHSAQAIYTMIFLPESMNKDKQREAKRKYEERKQKSEEALRQHNWELEREGYSGFTRAGYLLKRILKPITNVFAPLALLGPRTTSSGSLDWSLPMLALGSALYSMMMSIYSVKMQYAQLKFGWTAVELGNLLSIMGIVRIVALLCVIPLIVKLVRRPHNEPERDPPPNLSASEVEAGLSGFSKADDEAWDKHRALHRLIHDYKFDLILTRVSVCIDMASYTGLIFTKTVSHFILCVVGQSLGSGANPALSSLALMFADSSETGSLMGAIGVLQILFAQVFGPLVFNGVFAATVEYFPEGIFVVGSVVFGLVLVCMLIMRVRRPKWNGSSAANGGNDDEDDAGVSGISTAE